jgi:hypothetical protein
LFADFAELKAALPKVLAEIGAREQTVGSKIESRDDGTYVLLG